MLNKFVFKLTKAFLEHLTTNKGTIVCTIYILSLADNSFRSMLDPLPSLG